MLLTIGINKLVPFLYSNFELQMNVFIYKATFDPAGTTYHFSLFVVSSLLTQFRCVRLS